MHICCGHAYIYPFKYASLLLLCYRYEDFYGGKKEKPSKRKPKLVDGSKDLGINNEDEDEDEVEEEEEEDDEDEQKDEQVLENQVV